MAKTKFITETALFTALLVVIQFFTASFGQFVTGTCVNFILIAACLLCGFPSGLVVAVLSPFAAKLFGIGMAFLPLVPLVAVGNVVLVSVYAFWFRPHIRFHRLPKWWLSIISGAVCKYLVLYFGAFRLIVPLFSVPDSMAGKLPVAFGISQLLTALSGGVIAMIVVSLLWKTHRFSREHGEE